jgi:hypothetical protein
MQGVAVDPSYSNHRVKLFYRIFHAYGGKENTNPTAEDQAYDLLRKAREEYIAGNKDKAEMYLGYTIHYIQDALCPAHVFPFWENTLTDLGVITDFECITCVRYGPVWQSRVRNAKPIYISKPEDLRLQMVDKARWVNDNIDCSFVAQDGLSYRSTRQGVYVRISAINPMSVMLAGVSYHKCWDMKDEDIGSIMEMIAGLVKGAAIYAMLGVQPIYFTTTTSYFTTTSTTIYSTTTSRRCLVATAIYDSELSPEVQFLRDFRDNMVLSSFAGGSFMQAFNAWYYSFSPSVAEFISEHSTAKAVSRAALYPLVRILHLSSEVYSAFGSNAEMAVIVTGLIASSLIGVAYLLPIIILLTFSAGKRAGSRSLRSMFTSQPTN